MDSFDDALRQFHDHLRGERGLSPNTVAAYERDGRPVTTGLLAAATVSARLGAGAASSMRSALLAVGEGVARARGPFGRSISRQDADTLELLAEVMDLSDADPHRLFAFV